MAILLNDRALKLFSAFAQKGILLMNLMRLKKMLMIALTGLLAGLALVGCGGTAVPTQTPIPPTEAPTIPATLATQLPDLEIGGYTVTYDDCPWGGPGTVSVSVDNFGVGDAGPFEVTINNSTTTLDGLGSLGEAETAVTFDEGPVGSINAEVDSAQQVAEVDETNNSYMIVFTPPPPCATPTP
jgi:hypothetical protein